MVKVIENLLHKTPLMKCLNGKCQYYWLKDKTVIHGVCPKCGGTNVVIATQI